MPRDARMRGHRRVPLAVGLALLGVVLLAGCGGAPVAAPVPTSPVNDGAGATTSTDAPTTTEATTTTDAPTTTAPSPTTSTAAPATTEPPATSPPSPPPADPADPAADGTLREGEAGLAVLALQQRLVELGYWLGTADGTYGRLTQQAVLAFQKVEGLTRDGIAGPATLERLAAAARPAPRNGGTRVEIDLTRQVLFVVRDGAVDLTFNTSTGRAGWRTPPGEFAVYREIDGMRHAELGDLWRPKYFNGGIAIHGSGSIPAEPASHGCARLSNAAIDFLWASGLVPLGTPVSVY